MLTGTTSLTERRVVFRKGKSATDIGHAKAKAVKHGRQKIEHEISMLEAYLKGILKAATK